MTWLPWHTIWTLFIYTSLFCGGYYVGTVNRANVTRHKAWNPTAWASAILFDVARRAPNDADMVVAALYGVVEVCGLKRIALLAWHNRRTAFNAARGLTRMLLVRGKRDK